jgi:hypothetical protein
MPMFLAIAVPRRSSINKKSGVISLANVIACASVLSTFSVKPVNKASSTGL